MTNFSVWLITKDPQIQGQICADLINLPSAVEALSSDGHICVDEEYLNNEAFTLGFMIKSKVIGSSAELREKIHEIIKNRNIKYFALIVSEFSVNSAWIGTNCKTNQLINLETKSSSKKDIN